MRPIKKLNKRSDSDLRFVQLNSCDLKFRRVQMKTVILTQRHGAAPHIYICCFKKNSQDSKPSTWEARSLFLPAPGCSRSAELGVSLTHWRPRPWAQAASAGPARAGPPAHRGHWRARRFLGTHYGGRKASAGQQGDREGGNGRTRTICASRQDAGRREELRTGF